MLLLWLLLLLCTQSAGADMLVVEFVLGVLLRCIVHSDFIEVVDIGDHVVVVLGNVLWLPKETLSRCGPRTYSRVLKGDQGRYYYRRLLIKIFL